MTARAITTMLLAARRVARIGVLLQSSADSHTALEKRKAKAKQRYDDVSAKVKAFELRTDAAVEKLAAPLFPFYVANRLENSQHLAVGTGELQIKEGILGKTEKIGDDREIAAEISLLDPAAYAEIVTVSYTINGNLLRDSKYRGLVERMATVRIPFYDTFTVKPGNTSEVFRRPTSWFTARQASESHTTES